MAYQIKLYDYSLDGNDYCIGSDRLNLLELTWQLECAQGQDVDVHISSVGGSAFEAIGMYDALKKYPGKVTTYVDSLAASAASIIAMAGGLVVMSKYALLMIHKPMVGSGGNADQLEADVTMLNIVQSRLAGIYKDKTGLEDTAINELINATTWLTAEQALDLGFIDQIEDYSEADVTNLAHMRKYTDGNTPVYHKRIFNKLSTIQTNTMKTEDKELIEKNNGVLTKVMNFFKAFTVKTVTNKVTINILVPLAIGVAVTNEDGGPAEDGEYPVENEGKIKNYTVTDSIVTAMDGGEDDAEGDDEEVTNEAEKEAVENTAVLNSVGLKVTNKAEASGIAKVVTNLQKQNNDSALIIADLTKQLKVSNEAVARDEAKIKEDIKSDFTPGGSKRADKSTAPPVTDQFKPTTSVAQNAVKRALNGQAGLVK